MDFCHPDPVTNDCIHTHYLVISCILISVGPWLGTCWWLPEGTEGGEQWPVNLIVFRVGGFCWGGRIGHFCLPLQISSLPPAYMSFTLSNSTDTSRCPLWQEARRTRAEGSGCVDTRVFQQIFTCSEKENCSLDQFFCGRFQLVLGCHHSKYETWDSARTHRRT